MRIDVKKFLFLGLDSDRAVFFKKAQDIGIIHFIETSGGKSKELPQDIQSFISAIKILRGVPPVKQYHSKDFTIAKEIVHEILQQKALVEKLEEQLRVLKLDISRVAIFGRFNTQDLEFIKKEGKRVIQFFCARTGIIQLDKLPEEVIYVGSDHGMDYFVSISAEPKHYEKMVEMKIDHSLSELELNQKHVEKEHHAAVQHLNSLGQYKDYLHHAFTDFMDHYHLASAKTLARHTMEGSIFAVEGWVPVNKIDKLKHVCEDLSVHMDEIAIEPSDAVPTYLENEGAGRIGEDIIGIYDTPSQKDRDPSMWVLCCFALFFAFIVGDAGYGAVYLALALYLRYKFPDLQGLGKRMLDLMTIICVACIIWGILISSYFGMSIDIHNPVRKFSPLQWLAEKKVAYHMFHRDAVYQGWIKKWPELQTETVPFEFLSKATEVKQGHKVYELLSSVSDGIVMELALLIGVIHLMTSLFRYMDRNYAALGWVLCLIGGYLYFPYYLKTPSILNYVGGIDLKTGGEIGLYMMFFGLGFATLVNVIHNKLLGLPDVLSQVIQIFSDVLSYLRLYALGLSGAIVGGVINSMADSVPLIIAIVLMVLAHGVNMGLGIMSGVIHGLRLNFLEWYHYSFEGGGKKFQPLKLIKKE